MCSLSDSSREKAVIEVHFHLAGLSRAPSFSFAFEAGGLGSSACPVWPVCPLPSEMSTPDEVEAWAWRWESRAVAPFVSSGPERVGPPFPHLFLGRQPLLPGRLRGVACGSLCGVSNTMCMCWAVLRCFSCVRLIATLWTIVCQAPLSMQFSRQGYWSGLPCPPPRNLPDPGIKLVSLVSPALAGGFLTTWGAQCVHN